MRLLTLALAIVLTVSSALCHAQLVEIPWVGGTGSQQWQAGGNWSGGAFPNTTLQVADLSVNLGAGLTVDVGATDADVTIAGLSLGSTSGAVATVIESSGARLIFRNDDEDVVSAGNDADFDNDTIVTGRDFLIWQRGFGQTGDDINKFGDADGDDDVDGDDLVIWQDQYGLGVGVFNPGSPFIETVGVAGASNTISATIHSKNQQIEIGGTKNLTISGNLTYEPAESLVSNAGIRVMNPNLTVTVTGDIDISDTDSDEALDYYINTNGENQGTLILEGHLIGDGGTVLIGTQSSNSLLRFPLSTTRLSTANPDFDGSIRAGRGNLELGDDESLGSGSYTQRGPATFGYNLVAVGGDRTFDNEFTFSRSQTFKGENSITWSGDITSTNNSSLVNLLSTGKTVTLSGNVDIWEFDEFDESTSRALTIDGTGKTVITGQIRDVQLDGQGGSVVHGTGTFAVYGIDKTGTGSLVMNMADEKTNNHTGPTRVRMGNLHYSSNDSLNQSSDPAAKIVSLAGAVGVDEHPPGETLATNTTFLNKIDPTSKGGLMLANSDATTNLNFTSGALANAANMSVAAPETGLTYTGTITPASSAYKLGGGVGQLTLPNAQLTGANGLVVKNGGKVVLTGDNTYTGPTTIQAKYASTGQDQAAADGASGTSSVYYRQTAPILEVDDLANGGSASSIGSATSDAANLVIQGSTLRYVGTGDSTNRLFTIGTGGAVIDSSGAGAVSFSNAGALAVPDAANHVGTLQSGLGTSSVVRDVNDTSDVIIGMPISDPDPDPGLMFVCGLTGANCIPANTTVTGISDDGTQITMSNGYVAGITKSNTTLVFGAVARTLTLTGSNAQANILSPVISNSAKGGVVNILKQGTGTWLLEGMNTSTGTTTVEAGTLGGNGGVGGALTVNSGATFAPGGGATAIGDFSVGGSFTLNSGAILAMQLGGTMAGSYDVLNVTGAATLSGILNLSTVSFSPAMGNQFTLLTAAGGITDNGLTISGLTGFTKSIVGNSLVLTKTAALSALASVPEPSALVLMGLAMACLGVRRK